MSERQSRFDEAARGAGRDVDASRASVAVMTAGAHLSRVIERALADADLTLPQFNVLMELAASPDGALPMHAVIDRLIGTAANVSWLTTRMSERGLVSKDRATDDARVVVLAITEAGWDALQEGMPRVFAVEKQLWREYGRDDVCALSALLGPLLDNRGRR